MKSEELAEKLKHLKHLKQSFKDAELLAKESKRRLDEYQAQLFNEMRDHGLETIKHDGVSYVSKTTVFAHVQDDEAFQSWCQENQVDDVYLSLKEEKGRLNELVREAIDNGMELPPGVVWYPREYISITEAA